MVIYMKNIELIKKKIINYNVQSLICGETGTWQKSICDSYDQLDFHSPAELSLQLKRYGLYEKYGKEICDLLVVLTFERGVSYFESTDITNEDKKISEVLYHF